MCTRHQVRKRGEVVSQYRQGTAYYRVYFHIGSAQLFVQHYQQVRHFFVFSKCENQDKGASNDRVQELCTHAFLQASRMYHADGTTEVIILQYDYCCAYYGGP